MKDDDFKLLRGFDDGQTDEQTFVIVESLSRLKTESYFPCILYGSSPHVNPSISIYGSQCHPVYV